MVLILYVVAFWVRFHRKDVHSTILQLLLTLSYALGFAVIGVGLVRDDELPRWFRRGSVMSALGIFTIATAWLLFFVANKWVTHATMEVERRRKEGEKQK